MQELTFKGERIKFPGIYVGVPIDTYHDPFICGTEQAAEISLSSSPLRTIINESPAHYWCRSPLNPERIEKEETPALMLGRAAHHWLFGEDNFNKHFAVRPKQWDSWRTTDSRQWRQDMQEKNLGVLDPKQFAAVIGMAKVLAKHPMVNPHGDMQGVLNGLIERSIFWKDARTGIWLKVRPDALPNDSADVVDLKTISDVQYRTCMTAIAEHGYHQQAALVDDAFRQVLKIKMNTFTLFFIESKPPFSTRVVTLKEADINLGRRMNTAALDLFVKCYSEKDWPGPAGHQQDAAYMDLPDWYRERADDRLKYGV